MTGENSTRTASPPQRKEERERVLGVVAIFSEGDGRLPPACAIKKKRRIGRQSDVDIVVDDDLASRVHAEVSPSEGGVHVMDLGSRNGTRVDGEQVAEAGTFAPIGSIVRVGGTLLLVVDDVAEYRGFRADQDTYLIGGPALDGVRKRIAEAAASKSPVLVFGETGCGKELVAQAIHAASGRSGALVPVNCGSIPRDLVESELFGHARGAFSGSQTARDGLFRQADRGTLVLDELGELPLAAQPKLLRALESGEVRSVGSDHIDHVDVQVIGSTNRDLPAMVERGEFREDLYHRLAAVRIALPPLRQRRGDVPALVKKFLGPVSSRVSVDVMEALLRWKWPGNVRELRHTCRAMETRATDGVRIELAHLPDEIADADKGIEVDPISARKIELETLLRLREGNLTAVARDLDMRRATLYDELRRLGVDVDKYRKE